jgi:DNA-binding NarL/FixJ family response regulator
VAVETATGGRLNPVAAAIRALVVDDHDLFRRGLGDLLRDQGIAVVGEAADGAEGVRLARHVRPDVVVMDLNMPVMDGLEATRRIAAELPETRVLLLTIADDDDLALEVLAAGASGFLLKDASVTEIAAGVRAAAAGESPLSPRVANGLVERLREGRTAAAEREAELSAREVEVLRLMAQGHGNEEIARLLTISVATVKNHVSSILAKLGVDNRIQAAVHAVRRGLV